MRVSTRRLLTALIAALTLAAMASVADATTYEVEGSTFKSVFSTFSFGTTAGEGTVRCAVSLEGSFASASFNETRGARLASVTSASASGCTGGSATVLRETLPWSVNYGSVSGTAPNITAINPNLVGAAFRFQPTGLLSCLERSTTEAPIGLIWAREERGLITSFRTERASHIRLTGALCELGEGFVEGSTTSFTSPDEEELRVLVLVNAVDTSLVERADRTRLLPVTIGRNEFRVLEMLNSAIRTATFVGDPSSTDETNFRVEPSGARCADRGTLAGSLAAPACTIRIMTRAETPAGASADIRIIYKLGRGLFGNCRQEFVVRT